MVESTRVGIFKIGGESLYVCQTNATMYHLAVLGGSSSQPLQQSFVVYELGNGTPGMWSFFSWLFYNLSNLSLAPKIYARKLRPNSPPGIVGYLTNSYFTPTPWVWGVWGSLTGIKMWSNVIVRFWQVPCLATTVTSTSCYLPCGRALRSTPCQGERHGVGKGGEQGR